MGSIQAGRRGSLCSLLGMSFRVFRLLGGTIGALTFGVVDRVEFYSQPAALSLVTWQKERNSKCLHHLGQLKGDEGRISIYIY